MALFIKRKSDGVVFDEKTHVFGGGIVYAFRVNPGVSPAIYCPAIEFLDDVSIVGDKFSFQTDQSVSEFFWAYDTTFVEDSRINPNAETPALLTRVNETVRYRTTPNSPTSTATYEVVLNNPNNYKVQFSTNVEGTGGDSGVGSGGGTSGGYPVAATGWVDIEAPNGFYLVRSKCSDTNDQTIYIRYKRGEGASYPIDGSYRLAPNFPKVTIFTTGIGTVPIGTTTAVQSKGFCLVWGNSGEPTESLHGTHEEERWMLSQPQFRHQAPFYATNVTPVNIDVNQFNFTTGQPTGSTVSREVNMNYVLDNVAMDRYMEYLVESGLNGFGILHYANDGPLSTFRNKFRNLTTEKRRGAKAFHIVYSQGGGSTYTESINNMAADLAQSWYFKVTKVVGGTTYTDVPVLMALIDTSGDANVAAQVTERLNALNAVKLAAGITVSYNVLMTTNDDVSLYITGVNWDAKTNYYTYGDYAAGFADVARIARLSMEANASSKKLVPMVSAGLNQKARFFLKENRTDIGFYAFQSVVDNIQPMIQDAKGYCDAGNSPFWMVGVADENTEQGEGFFPTINVDNIIDKRIITKCKEILNRDYVSPTPTV